MGMLTTVRDEVYLRIATKQTAESFYFANDFVLEKTWRPWEELQDLFDPTKFPSGKVYIVGGRPGDIVSLSRTNMALREYPVHLGFQHKINRISDTAEIDEYVNFIEELEETLRTECDNVWLNIAFTRLEPLRDPDGVPYSFITLRDSNLFESYFTAFFTAPASENVSTTTTTTT